MAGAMIEIRDEAPWLAGAREALLDRTFGPARFDKPSERLREGREATIALAAIDIGDGSGADLIGSIRLWNVESANGRPALLLGPLAVDDGYRSLGLGARLIRQALNRAAAAGHPAVILVGDAPYYQRFGFACALTQDLEMPGPVDRDRFLALELVSGSLQGAAGMLKPSGKLADPRAFAHDYCKDMQMKPWPPVR